jgi:hypothetical protein
MIGWEYLTFEIHYDRKKHKDWVLQFAERSPLVGMKAILEAYGADGWELVSLEPDGYRAIPGFGQWDLEPRIYRATFKRPVENR